ncbi:MAG: 4Fe-4S binding protein [Deltaproteobacteria bacterium]|nr:4Fe-4S binding protein [Deltaproteobacteria bacterium]
MKKSLHIISLSLVLTLVLFVSVSNARVFHKKLSSDILNAPDLCAHVPCKELMPLAGDFSERKGNPKYIEAYQTIDGAKKTIGYLFLSVDIVDIPAYSGQPIVTLISMDMEGIIKGVKIIQHSEPILMVGIPEEELTRFADQYIGLKVGTKTKLGDSEDPNVKTLDAVSGATVTVIAEDLTIMKSTRLIAEQVGIIQAVSGIKGRLIEDFTPMSWKALIDKGLLGHLRVNPDEVGYEQAKEGEAWIDIYFGYLNLPSAGLNLMGKNNYRWVKKEIEKGGHAFVIVSNGVSSFKGSGFVRGGIFERFGFEQRGNNFTFRDLDYYNFYDIAAEGAPEFKEGGVYIIREKGFSPFEPFAFNFLSAHVVGSIERKFNVFKSEYQLPDNYMVIEKVAEEDEPVWVEIWKSNIVSEIFLIILLIIILLLFTQRLKLVRNRVAAKWTKYTIMAIFLVFIGFYKMAAPSVTQLITVLQKFVGNFDWSLFLLDPMIFILWWFIAISIILWGRGIFCGWLCPYGTLTEFAYRIFHTIVPNKLKFEFSYKVHSKLMYLKYVIFLVLLGLSFYSMEMAERYAEIEPFKTAFLVGLNREWYYVFYFFLLLAFCLVNYRFFCKYLCPLGAGLAIPSTLSLFGIKRREFCTKCNICAKECGSGAINEKGEINMRECLYCLDCEENFVDMDKCPPLVKKKKGSA